MAIATDVAAALTTDASDRPFLRRRIGDEDGGGAEDAAVAGGEATALLETGEGAALGEGIAALREGFGAKEDVVVVVVGAGRIMPSEWNETLRFAGEELLCALEEGVAGEFSSGTP